jgi:DNA-directed RNA polymerase subunit RPC12/RpoP
MIRTLQPLEIGTMAAAGALSRVRCPNCSQYILIHLPQRVGTFERPFARRRYRRILYSERVSDPQHDRWALAEKEAPGFVQLYPHLRM